MSFSNTEMYGDTPPPNSLNRLWYISVKLCKQMELSLAWITASFLPLTPRDRRMSHDFSYIVVNTGQSSQSFSKNFKNLITSSLLLHSSLKITLLFPLTPVKIYMSPTVVTWKPIIIQAYTLGNSPPLRPIYCDY